MKAGLPVMSVNHVTFQLKPAAINTNKAPGGKRVIEGDLLADVMTLIGFEEIEPDDPFEHGYIVRWFRPRHRLGITVCPVIHFVAVEGKDARKWPWSKVHLGLGHFCVVGLGEDAYRAAIASDYLLRDSGSGRAWLLYDSVRIEIRP
jgi:hypothetical protein